MRAAGAAAALRRLWNPGVTHAAPAVAYAVAIFLLSARERGDLPSLGGWDFPLHVLEYGGLGFLLRRLTARLGARRGVSSLVVPVLLGGLYGLADEVHQLFVPGRELALADFLADVLGALLGAGAHAWVRGGCPEMRGRAARSASGGRPGAPPPAPVARRVDTSADRGYTERWKHV